MRTKSKKKSSTDSTGGTYVYDKKLGRVVKVSDRIPKVASKGRGAASEMGPCGRPRAGCGGGSCS